jgi:MFS family permease
VKQNWVKRRWIFVFFFFGFMFVHQFDIYFLSPSAAQFFWNGNAINIFQNPMNGPVILVSLIFFLIWGYNFDRHSRRKLLAGAAFLWWITRWLMSFSPTLGTFLISYAASGVDHASYSGIFALVGDYFEPKNRSKVFGFFFLAHPLVFLAGLFLTYSNQFEFTWRTWLLVVGAVGLICSIFIALNIHDPKRGHSEPALAKIAMMGVYQFDWEVAKVELRKPALLTLFALSLFSMIPWTVLTNWLYPYFRDSLGMPSSRIYLALLPGLFGVVLGYPLGGALGDFLFTYRRRGRVIVSLFGNLMASVCLCVAFLNLESATTAFIISIALMGLFLGFLLPNLAASLMDVTLPELRGTAYGIMLLLQSAGILLTPLFVNLLQNYLPLDQVILWICVGAWLIGAVLHIALFKYLPDGIEDLRRHLAYRGLLEARIATLNYRRMEG